MGHDAVASWVRTILLGAAIVAVPALAHPAMDPMEVALGTDDPLAIGGTVRLLVTVTARNADYEGAVVNLTAPPPLEVRGPRFWIADLPRDQPMSMPFTIDVNGTGFHLVQARVTANGSWGPVGGYRQAYIVVAHDGPGGFYVDHLPGSPFAGCAPLVNATDAEVRAELWRHHNFTLAAERGEIEVPAMPDGVRPVRPDGCGGGPPDDGRADDVPLPLLAPILALASAGFLGIRRQS